MCASAHTNTLNKQIFLIKGKTKEVMISTWTEVFTHVRKLEFKETLLFPIFYFIYLFFGGQLSWADHKVTYIPNSSDQSNKITLSMNTGESTLMFH